MGFRFRRRVNIFPGISLNFGKKGVSVSAGVRGAKITVGKTGIRKTVGIPGSGLSYTEHTSFKRRGKYTYNKANYQVKPYHISVLLLVLTVVSICLLFQTLSIHVAIVILLCISLFAIIFFIASNQHNADVIADQETDIASINESITSITRQIDACLNSAEESTDCSERRRYINTAQNLLTKAITLSQSHPQITLTNTYDILTEIDKINLATKALEVNQDRIFSR